MNNNLEQNMPQTPQHWSTTFGQSTVALLVVANLFLYDARVAEVSGDLRWVVTHLTTVFLGIFALISWLLGWRQLPFKSYKDIPAALWCALGLGFWAAVSLLDAFNLNRGLWLLQHLTSYILLFLLVIFYAGPHLYKILVWGISLGLALNALLGIAQYFAITDTVVAQWLPFWPQGAVIDVFKQAFAPAATFSNKNLAASAMVLGLPITFFALLSAKKRWQQAVAALCFTLCSIFLVYTRSRWSWISALAALLFLVLWLSFSKQARLAVAAALKPSFRLWALVFSVCTIILAGQMQSHIKQTYGVSDTVGQRIGSIFEMFHNAEKLGSRLAYNINGVVMVKDHPFNGVGLGNFHTVYPLYHNAVVATPLKGYSLTARPRRTHNDILQMFIETGLPGGLLYLGFFAAVAWAATSTFRTTQNAEHRLFALLGLTAVVGIGVNALGDFPLQMPTAPVLLWALSGCLVAQNLQNKAAAQAKPLQPTTQALIAGALLLLCAYATWISFDNLRRYSAELSLKPAMSLVSARIYNEQTLALIEQAYQTHPNNQRLQEFRAVIYANHTGPAHNLQKDIAVMEEALQNDPYAANMLINLINAHTQNAITLQNSNKPQMAKLALNQAFVLYKKLEQVAPPVAIPLIVGGILYDTTRHPELAIEYYRKALVLEPENDGVRRRLELLVAQQRAKWGLAKAPE